MYLISVMHERNSVSSMRIVVKGFHTSKETTSMKSKPHSLCVIELTAVELRRFLVLWNMNLCRSVSSY
jgi:hypothetical protein